MSALAFMMKNFPEIKEVEDMRKSIGRYGLTGKQQVCTILEAIWTILDNSNKRIRKPLPHFSDAKNGMFWF